MSVVQYLNKIISLLLSPDYETIEQAITLINKLPIWNHEKGGILLSIFDTKIQNPETEIEFKECMGFSREDVEHVYFWLMFIKRHMEGYDTEKQAQFIEAFARIESFNISMLCDFLRDMSCLEGALNKAPLLINISLLLMNFIATVEQYYTSETKYLVQNLRSVQDEKKRVERIKLTYANSNKEKDEKKGFLGIQSDFEEIKESDLDQLLNQTGVSTERDEEKKHSQSDDLKETAEADSDFLNDPSVFSTDKSSDRDTSTSEAKESGVPKKVEDDLKKLNDQILDVEERLENIKPKGSFTADYEFLSQVITELINALNKLIKDFQKIDKINFIEKAFVFISNRVESTPKLINILYENEQFKELMSYLLISGQKLRGCKIVCNMIEHLCIVFESEGNIRSP